MTEMTDREALIATRELISDPARWTSGEEARDAAGNHISARDPKAVCWCIEGAYIKFRGRAAVDNKNPGWAAVRQASIELYTERAPFRVNDVIGRDAALSLLDHAIERVPT